MNAVTDASDASDESNDWGVAPAPALTAGQAAALRGRSRGLTPWRVVLLQAVVGALVAVLAGWIAGSASAAWSALWGAAVVVVPGALMARGLARNLKAGAKVAVFGFVVWQLMKLGVAVAMLAASMWVVPGLSWPALLVAMLVCTKTNWLALLWRGRGTDRSQDL